MHIGFGLIVYRLQVKVWETAKSSDHQQSWGYEEGPSKKPALLMALILLSKAICIDQQV